LSAIVATAGLSACLPDEKDPDKSADAGSLSGAYYASGLGSIALQIQNAVVGNASWFNAVGNGMELDLASMGIASNALGAPVKSNICPTGSGTEVTQITWIDGRDANGKFAVKGLGTDAGTIMGALRTRVASEQAGIFHGGNTIAMSDGRTLAIPSSCGSLNIPMGAPVVAFDISRPAPPTAELARTEYKTEACGVDATGRQKRGTQVLKRVVRYNADGTIVPGSWDTEKMGDCVPDAVVEVTERDYLSGARNADLNNFANVALRNLLAQQLQMDCTKTTVKSSRDVNSAAVNADKQIDTCALRAQGTGTTVIAETNTGDTTDSKTLYCTGATALNLQRFVNLSGTGTSTTSWTSGTATLVRVVDNSVIDDGTSGEGQRKKWVGTNINCGGDEKFHVGCGQIPGNPAIAGRASGTKWVVSGITGWFVYESWLNSAFNVCWFGSCKRITGGTATNLNPAYFTGTDQLQNGGTTTSRGMGADSWINPETFEPLSKPTTAWSIYDNQCLWAQRVMMVDCPFTVTASQQSTWASSFAPWNARPATLDPGIGSNGTDSGNMYAQMRAAGNYTANVTLNWEDCNIKGCDHWSEGYGPGTGAYIKSWNTNGYASNTVNLSQGSVSLRTDLCNSVAFQLNAGDLSAQTQAALTAATADKQAKQDALTAATLDKTNKQDALNDANSALTTATNTYNLAHTDAVDKRADADAKLADYNTKKAHADSLGSGDPGKAAAVAAANDALTAYNDADALADTAEANAATKQTAMNSAQTAATAAQTAYNSSVTTYNTALASYNASVTAYNTAAANAEAAANSNNAAAGRALTAQETQGLQTIKSNICSTTATTLDPTQQSLTSATCKLYYDSPSNFTAAPSFGPYCDSVFDRRGPGGTDCNTPSGSTTPVSCPGYSLAFRINVVPASGYDVQTTLLNTEGVRLAWRPQVENNQYLITRQNGFTEPLQCLRSEYNYITWPVVKYYWVCGGKGGCWQSSYGTSATIIQSTVRQWSGYSYETGSWSAPQTGYIAPWGNYWSLSQIPSPYYTW
jgi:hypothetical protein